MADELFDISSNDVNKRIILFMETQGFKLSEFADYLGIPRSRMTHIKNGRNKPNLEFIVKLLNKFPNLNPEWLLLGKGSMFKVPPHQADKQEDREKAADREATEKKEKHSVEQEVSAFEALTASVISETNSSSAPNALQNLKQPEHTTSSNECETDNQHANNQSDSYQTSGNTNKSQPSGQTLQNQIPPQGQPVVVPGPNGQPAQILILYPDHTFVAYRARE